MVKIRRGISVFVILCVLIGIMPTAALGAKAADDYVYLSISFDGTYIDDKNNEPMVYVPVSLKDISAVDLKKYGLDNMRYDGNGDGKDDITALQLLIYAHEELYGGDWSDVTFDAIPGSSYFQDGIFGFTENLVYFLNGDFPVDESQTTDPDAMTVGATSDRITLKAGDFLDIASFSCYSFLWDQLGGFHLFSDANDNYTHDYTATAGQALSVKLKHSFCDLMYGQSWVKDAVDYEVFYGAAFGEAIGSARTDSKGFAQITFPDAGTYYVWCVGGRGEDLSTHSACDYCLATGEICIVSSPAFAKVTVAAATPEQPENSRHAQDVSTVLNAALAMQAVNVAQPSFGTNYGEWTVFGLARGGYYTYDSQYFADYYQRIVECVNTTAAAVNLSGALDKNKSTDNSRLIMALSAIGKDATSVGDWNLVEAYSANGINWIRKQGINGTIWTLIALDCGNYETSDPTIRQQCVDAIINAQHNDGGWSLVTAKTQPSNVDITGMALTALYPYRDNEAVAEACEEAFAWLSESQLDNGGFPYGKGETSESCAWAIVAMTTWGINPDTDPRFVKNGNSAIDNLLTYYVEDEAMFEHGRGAGSNAMATDQACYALVAYDRLINGKTGLYDYSDVTSGESSGNSSDAEQMTATLGLPDNINAGDVFNGVISTNKWDNTENFKLIDFIVNVPNGLDVTEVAAGSRLSGGAISWNLEKDTGKLRVVYFDANEHSTLTVTGEEFPAELFTISFKAENVTAGSALHIAVSGMSVKRNSDPEDEKSMVVVNTDTAKATTNVVAGISFSAKCLYTGDDVDLIPADRKAVVVAVTGIAGGKKLSYNDGANAVEFSYSAEISQKTGVSSYVALVDAAIAMENFVNEQYFTTAEADAASVTFGDTNGDGVVNAQDALNVVDAWLRKGDTPADGEILTMNVNCDSRINTFDALGIVEAFVNKTDYIVVTKAATITTKP